MSNVTGEMEGSLPLGIAGLAYGLFSGNRANYNRENAPPTGYQGVVPDYTLVRENVLDTYDPDRVPGSRGQRYFSDFAFVPSAYTAPTATGQTITRNDPQISAVRQTLFDQANVGPDSLRAQNYARMGKEAPDIGDRGPTGIDSVLQLPTSDQINYSMAPSVPNVEDLNITDMSQPQFFGNGVVYVPGYGVVNYYDEASLLNYLAFRDGNLGTGEESGQGTEETDTQGGQTDTGAEAGAPPAREDTPAEEEPTPPPEEERPADAYGNVADSESPFNFTDAPADQTTYANRDEIRNIAIDDGSGLRRIAVPFGRLTDNQREQLIRLSVEEPNLDVRARQTYELLKGFFGLKNAQAQGGVTSLMGGGYLSGSTDGMADMIDASIDNTQPAALSDGEFVIPADVVSHLGNGNSDAGADVLYGMMANIRKARTGNTKQGTQIDPNQFMPKQKGMA